MTAQEENLCRWCYIVAGFSRARLARDFECSIAEVEKIVSTGLGEMLSPGAKVTPKVLPPRTQVANDPHVIQCEFEIFRRLLGGLACD
jgi:hypothetical protein